MQNGTLKTCFSFICLKSIYAINPEYKLLYIQKHTPYQGRNFTQIFIHRAKKMSHELSTARVFEALSAMKLSWKCDRNDHDFQ